MNLPGLAPSAEISRHTMTLFFRIRDGHPKAQLFAYYLEYLTFHIQPERLEPALEWLVRNKITGDHFVNFVQGDCARSPLELMRQLTMRIEHEKKVRPLTRGDIQG